ncbi:unnamed protein product [Protopolystoma xenopodis]|uniref:Uncharacterized protein n=1 Tax=Protopolystoma xenopodis TaxID=117903 RepID=A0A448X8L9_9PLAT|nr:unnamed protein product [Protopolystoma xenopodis]
MCRTPAEVRAQAGGWAGTEGGSRAQLIARVQTFIPAQTMLPPRRLEELVDDAISAQIAACTFHNQLGPPLQLTTPGSGTRLLELLRPLRTGRHQDNFSGISLLQRHSCGM